MVPEYEEREAARFSGYTWTEWETSTHLEHVHAIAYYRAHIMIENHVQHAVNKAIERKQRQRHNR